MKQLRKTYYKLFTALFYAFQPFPLEDKHIKHANSDGSISKVEDGPEENEMAIGTKEEIRQPRGIFLCHVNDGEIEHIDHASMQPSGITAAIREQNGQLGEGTLAEDTAIEHTIDDVAHCARRDERQAEQHTKLGVFLRKSENDDEPGNDCHNAEEAQYQLHGSSAAQPAKGHAFVLDEQQLEPLPDDGNLFAQSHVQFDPNLEDLALFNLLIFLAQLLCESFTFFKT